MVQRTTFAVYKKIRYFQKHIEVVEASAPHLLYCAQLFPPDPPADTIERTSLHGLASDLIHLFFLRCEPLAGSGPDIHLSIKAAVPGDYEFSYYPRQKCGVSAGYRCHNLSEGELGELGDFFKDHWPHYLRVKLTGDKP